MRAPRDKPGVGPLLLFGGTFDPPHLAHTTLAAAAARQLAARRVVFIPAALSPLKIEAPAVTDAHRLAMLRLALEAVSAGGIAAEVSTVELVRGGQSYFIDTLEELRDEIAAAGGARFLIGVDQALHFHRWKDWLRILEIAAPAVMLRPPWSLASYEKALHDHFEAAEAERWRSWTLDLPLMDISASAIRKRLREGRRLADMLDPKVDAYIRRHGLYAASAG